MNLTEQIYSLLDAPDTTLVFPTENTARHWLASYVRDRHTSILGNRAMAFDKFRAMFAPHHDDLKPANKYHRLSFVSWFLESRKTNMVYLYKDALFGYRQRFVAFLARILPKLSELTTTGIVNPGLFGDLRKLSDSYSEYLERNGLFEPGWEFCNLRNAKGLSGRYVLVGSDADVQMQGLLKELGDSDFISTLELGNPKTCVYEQFLTEETELETLFARLEVLKAKGVPTKDIILVTPRLQALSSRLERKALEYDIPLSFMKSLSLSETVPGRYLFALRRCIDEDLSFASMENLLLDSALPFRDIGTNRRLIRFMIDKNIRSGSIGHKSDVLSDALFNAHMKAEQDLYNVLRYSLVAIRKSRTGDELIKDIHGITCDLFGNDEFGSGDPMDKDVYSFIFTELANINTTLKENGLEMDGIFSVFMGEVDRLSYVTQEKKEGIRVYAYGQDYLMNVPYRFLFGLNDQNYQTRKVPLDFLEDHEVSSRDVLDVTERLLDYYLGSAENIHVSGSETDYDGAQSVPSYFVTKDSGIRKISKPEEGVCGYAKKADLVSMEQASQTSFAEMGTNLAKEGSFPVIEEPEKVPLSYSSINNYVTCPYKAMLSRIYPRDFAENFEPAEQDDKLIGDFLHEVIQSFMEKHFNEHLKDSLLEEYYDEIEEEFDELLDDDKYAFDDFTKQCIRENYLVSEKRVVSELLLPDSVKSEFGGEFIPRANEYRLTEDPSFTGRIDTVIESADGRVFLFDYKKGDGNATYQLILYKRLYEKQTGEDVENCYFYSMKDGVFRTFSAENRDSKSLELEVDTEKTRDGYIKGVWVASPSKQHCERCDERSICRRRFNLQ